MIKVWFLMALMAFPTSPVIFYKGFAAYETLEVCESKRIPMENLIMETEIGRGRVVYVKTFCMERTKGVINEMVYVCSIYSYLSVWFR